MGGFAPESRGFLIPKNNLFTRFRWFCFGTNGWLSNLQIGCSCSGASTIQPGVVKQRNITYIPVARYIEILTNLSVSPPKTANERGDNREYEVGRRGRRWARIDDRIEEETTSYKFKM